MKYIKQFENHDDEEYLTIEHLKKEIKKIISYLGKKEQNIIDIIKFGYRDLGAYALVRIFGKTYKIWEIEDQLYGTNLWIENFPIDNTSQDYKLPGLEGPPTGIAKLLHEIENAGGIELYQAMKNYNL